MEPCPYGEGCIDYKCKYQHPPSWWVCDYGPLCFIAGCPGVHPEQCKQTPCTRILHCNFSHVKACEYGANCLNPNCTDLHPPPCENLTCNGADCIFMHPTNEKYKHISSLSQRNQGQNQGKQNRNQNPNPNQGQFSPQAAPSNNGSWSRNPPNNVPTNTMAKSNIPCRFGAKCTKYPNCEFLHSGPM